jgi:hypothetical protein
MTDFRRDAEIQIANAKADKALGAAFKKDLGLLLEKYKAEMSLEIDYRTDSAEINFYSPSKYEDGERVKANLDIDFTERTSGYDLT